ncbi:MAG: hypothetical protein VYA84_19505 [Planctomycetota bacterium]|nr:hypothetical protein [Planctomycetota bacterium]
MQLISPQREVQTTQKPLALIDVACIDKEGRVGAPIRQVDDFTNGRA